MSQLTEQTTSTTLTEPNTIGFVDTLVNDQTDANDTIESGKAITVTLALEFTPEPGDILYDLPESEQLELCKELMLKEIKSSTEQELVDIMETSINS